MFEPIKIGLVPNDGRGDTPRELGEKLNRMLEALFDGAPIVARLDPIQQAFNDNVALLAANLGGRIDAIPTASQVLDHAAATAATGIAAAAEQIVLADPRVAALPPPPSAFGAIGGNADDTAALNRWLATGGILEGGDAVYTIYRPLFIPSGAKIRGRPTFRAAPGFQAFGHLGFLNGAGDYIDLGDAIIDGGELMDDSLGAVSGFRAVGPIKYLRHSGVIKNCPFMAVDIPANSADLICSVAKGSKVVRDLSNGTIPLTIGNRVIAPGVFPRDTVVESFDPNDINTVTFSKPALVTASARRIHYLNWSHGKIDLRTAEYTNCGWRGVSIEGARKVFFPDHVSRTGGSCYADTACGKVFYADAVADRSEAPFRVYYGGGNPRANLSLSTRTIGLGEATFVLESGARAYQYEIGTDLHFVARPGLTDNNLRMIGTITGYDPVLKRITVQVHTTRGFGTYSAWTVTGEFEGFFLWDPATQFRTGGNLIGYDCSSSPGDGYMLSEDGVGDWGPTTMSSIISYRAGWAGVDLPSNFTCSSIFISEAGTTGLYAGLDFGGTLKNSSVGILVIVDCGGPAAIRFAASYHGTPTAFRNIQIRQVVVSDSRETKQMLHLVSAHHGPSTYANVSISNVTPDGVPVKIVIDGDDPTIPEGLTVEGSQTDAMARYVPTVIGMTIDTTDAFHSARFKRSVGSRAVELAVKLKCVSTTGADQLFSLPVHMDADIADRLEFRNFSSGAAGYVEYVMGAMRLREVGGGFTPVHPGQYFQISGRFDELIV